MFNRFIPDRRCLITSSPKTNTSLRRTVRAVPKVSVLEGVHCIIYKINFHMQMFDLTCELRVWYSQVSHEKF